MGSAFTLVWIVVGGSVLAMSLTHSAVLRDRKKVQDAFLAVNAALRGRTDAVYDLLAAVKDVLKGQPPYDQAFEALKATLTPEALDNPATMAEAETALGHALVPLVAAIRADGALRAKPESQAAFAKLTIADGQIHERVPVLNEATAHYNDSLKGGLRSVVAAALRLADQPTFAYDAPKIG